MPKTQNTPPTPPKYEVRIHAIHMDGKLRATASVNIYGDFAVRNVRVREGANGLFVSMPSYKNSSGEYKDICFPCTKEAKTDFDAAVIGAYRQAMTQSDAALQQDDTSQPEQVPPTMVGP